MRYELMISLRYLFSRRRKRFISFMSLVSILGVAVGVACLITVLAVMNGFGSELQKRIIGSNPHIIIEKENGIAIADYDSFSKDITKIEGVKGIYPYVWGQGVLKYRNRAQGAAIRSIDLNNSADLSKLAKHMQTPTVELGERSIILGSELAAVLGAFAGDEIEVMTSSSLQQAEKFKVTGIFSSGYYEYDANLAYVNIADASSLFNMGQAISGIGVDADNIDKVVGIKQGLLKILPGSYYVRTWMDLNSNLFSALALEKWTMFVILTLIVIVAALNIISTLSVMVTEKTKDIGVLKAIGADSNLIMRIFSLQGLMIGIIGVALGGTGGIGLSFLLKNYHLKILPESIYYGINYLPVEIDIADSFVIIASAILISFIASIYPAYQASRLNPVDALRYE